MTWEPIGATIEAGASLANTAIQAVTAKKNREFQKEQNEITRQREDTAHQRETADLEAAGLSPLANLSGADTSTPIAENQEAPQLDLSAMNDMIAMGVQKDIADREIEMREEELDWEREKHGKEMDFKEKELKETKRQFDENQKLTKEIKNTEIANRIQEFLTEEERLNEELELSSQYNTRQQQITLSQVSENTYKNLCDTWEYNFPKKTTTNYNEYLEEYNKFNSELNNFIVFFRGDGVKEPNTGESKSAGGGAEINAGAKIGGGITGVSGHGGVGAHGETSDSFTRSGKWTKQSVMEKYIEEYCKKSGKKMEEFMVYPEYKPNTSATNYPKPKNRQKYTPQWSFVK